MRVHVSIPFQTTKGKLKILKVLHIKSKRHVQTLMILILAVLTNSVSWNKEHVLLLHMITTTSLAR